MDPVSLALGIAGVLPLVVNAIKYARGYRDAIRNRSNTIAALVAQLETLESCLKSLDQLLAAQKSGNLVFSDASVLKSLCSACELKLKVLCKKLGQTKTGRTARFLWPLTESEHEATMQDLRNFVTWLQFSLSIDGCRLLSHTREDVLDMMYQQLEHFRTIQAVESQAQRLNEMVQEQSRMLEKSQEIESRRRTLDWISTMNQDHKHLGILEARAENTGSWLLQRAEYVRWRDDLEAENNILWCSGIQGSGKTNITSVIIDDVMSHAINSASPVAFFYFDYQDQANQTPASVLRCILRQLVESLPTIPESVTDLRVRSRDFKEPLPQHECERLILDTLRESGSSYLIVDALDECDGLSNRAAFLQAIKRIRQDNSLRILITSRPHVEDVRKALESFPQITIEAKDQDIRTYLRQELSRPGVSEVVGTEFADKLLNELPERAHGMFLLPVIQLRSILKEPTLGEMEDALERIPDDLNQALKDTIERIRSQPESRARLGMNALMWISHSRRPLTISELIDALAVKDEQTRFRANYRPTSSMVLECCQGLVNLDSETNGIRPAHYSIQQYLAENSSTLFPHAIASMAIICLKFLSFEDFKDGPWDAEKDIASQALSYPFLFYAASSWGTHSKGIEHDPNVWSSLHKFFGSKSACAVANQILRFCTGFRREYYNPDECRSFTPLHHAARSGLVHCMNYFLDTNTYAVNEVTQMGATPIILAAANDEAELVKILLQRGADPYLRNWYGNALHCAVEAGCLDAMRELIEWGLRPQPLDEYIDCTMDRDREEAFEILFEQKEPHPDSKDPSAVDYFQLAATIGNGNIVEVMIKRKWVDMEVEDESTGQRAVHLAAAALRPHALHRLIVLGANLNAVDKTGKTAMDYAVQFERYGNIDLLQASEIFKQH